MPLACAKSTLSVPSYHGTQIRGYRQFSSCRGQVSLKPDQSRSWVLC